MGKVGVEKVDLLSRELVEDLTKFETDPQKIRNVRSRVGDMAELLSYR